MIDSYQITEDIADCAVGALNLSLKPEDLATSRQTIPPPRPLNSQKLMEATTGNQNGINFEQEINLFRKDIKSKTEFRTGPIKPA